MPTYKYSELKGRGKVSALNTVEKMFLQLNPVERYELLIDALDVEFFENGKPVFSTLRKSDA